MTWQGRREPHSHLGAERAQAPAICWLQAALRVQQVLSQGAQGDLKHVSPAKSIGVFPCPIMCCGQ